MCNLESTLNIPSLCLVSRLREADFWTSDDSLGRLHHTPRFWEPQDGSEQGRSALAPEPTADSKVLETRAARGPRSDAQFACVLCYFPTSPIMHTFCVPSCRECGGSPTFDPADVDIEHENPPGSSENLQLRGPAWPMGHASNSLMRSWPVWLGRFNQQAAGRP